MTPRTGAGGRPDTTEVAARGAAPLAGCPMATAPPVTSHHPVVRVAIGGATAAALIAVVVDHRADPVTSVLLAIVVLIYGVLSAVDIAEQRLPNRITLPLAAATTLAVLAGGIARSNLVAALGALGIGLTFAFVLLATRFGMGDVKLALTVGTIAGWLGRDAIVTTAWVGAMSGAAVAVVLIVVFRRRDVAFSFGPFLAIGSVAGMLAVGS
ncbi:MAG: prepilin peptidase [Actinomycetia bacterium]|nr:prepilin peptidase [Actinomycetes bacterium]